MGGRGGSSGLAGGGTVTASDWEAWAEDPWPFQAALNGDKMPTMSEADGHVYTKEELDRIRKMAPVIQAMAESGIVDDHTLFRGESYESPEAALKKYHEGAVITNDKLTSYATREGIADSYAGGQTEWTGHTKVVISNTNVSRNIYGSVGVMTDPMGVGGSYEVITPKGMKSRVISSYYSPESNTVFVTMQNEAEPKKRK